MDSLTQIVLGGAVGEAVLGKKVGNKAVLWGAIGGTMPDLDTIPGQFLDTVSRLEIHRGFSHSIVFALLVAPILGFLIQRLYKKKKETDWWGWTQLFFWAIFTHPLLDIFTTWGTQLLWPLEWRIAIQSIFVIDPLYTLPFLICLTAVLFFNRKNLNRKKWNQIGLWVSSVYLIWSVAVKLFVDNVFQNSLKSNHIRYTRFDSRPTPFNTLLWTSNVELENEFLISYYSLLDQDHELMYSSFPKNSELLDPFRNNNEVERLIKLTKGFYTIEKTEKGIAMNDLRFGLLEGFNKGKGEFVFTYLINQTEAGVEITQKEQSFEGMDEVMGKLWLRILGTKSF